MIAITPAGHPRHWHRLMRFATQTLLDLSIDESINDQILHSALDQLMSTKTTDAVSCLERLIVEREDVLDAFISQKREHYQVMFELSFAESLRMTYIELLKHSLHEVDNIRRAVRKDDYLDGDAVAAALNLN